MHPALPDASAERDRYWLPGTCSVAKDTSGDPNPHCAERSSLSRARRQIRACAGRSSIPIVIQGSSPYKQELNFRKYAYFDSLCFLYTYYYKGVKFGKI